MFLYAFKMSNALYGLMYFGGEGYSERILRVSVL